MPYTNIEKWEIGCSDGPHNSFWKTVVTSPEWQAWEKENSRRMHEEPIGNCFDVDECRECGWMSVEHFKEFIAFTNQKALSSFKAKVEENLERAKRHSKGAGDIIFLRDGSPVPRGNNTEDCYYNLAIIKAINIIKNLE